jgi:tetratricopeptide (TPR) repeat protein
MNGSELRDAEEQALRAIDEAGPLEKPRVASRAADRMLKQGEPLLAARLYRRAEELAPRDPELPHSRGLAHLESGDVGLAQDAQARALALDPGHMGARAQRAAALEALGDDAGAAFELGELLKQLGPQPALSARLIGLQDAAVRASKRRLLGKPLSALSMSPLIGTALARSIGDPLKFRAPFASLQAFAHDGRVSRLEMLFDSLDASMGRSDASYGATMTDEHDRRVPLDEFSAAAIVFLAESLGIETSRARRILSFLLTPDCGTTEQKFASVKLGWILEGEGPSRKYGLYAAI